MDRFNTDTLFGNTAARAAKVFATYNDRETGTGVLLTGDKGSGKTLLSKYLSNLVLDAGMPVILVNQAYAGDGFNTFMNDIGHCCVIFDEFAKTYTDEDQDSTAQDALLTFFDGTMSAKRLCIVTENEEFRINDFMKSRPGRMFYHFRYGKLDETTILEVCEATMTSGKEEQLLEFSRRVQVFSYDILGALIEESNRFPDASILELADDLNVPVIDSMRFNYKVTKVTDLAGVPYKVLDTEPLTHYTDSIRVIMPNIDYTSRSENYSYISGYNDSVVYAKDSALILENHGNRIHLEVVEMLILAYTI